MVAVVPGSATSHILDPSSTGASLCVRPIVDAVPGDDVCCTAICPDLEPIPPGNLQCTLQGSCDASLTWQNPVPYQSISVRVDGVVVTVLPGSVESVVVALGGVGPHDVCLQAETICGGRCLLPRQLVGHGSEGRPS